MDARPVLGVSPLRPPLLVDLSTARSRKGETGRRTRVVRTIDSRSSRGPRALFMICFELEDDLDDDLDEDDDFDDDDADGDEEDSEDDEEDADTETWQVSSVRGFR